jgi:hypothetical protein
VTQVLSSKQKENEINWGNREKNKTNNPKYCTRLRSEAEAGKKT